MTEKAILFIDGNNWYHACRQHGVEDLFTLDYVAIAKKLTRITVHLGRIEERPRENELASAILKYLPGVTLDPAIRSHLTALANQHAMVSYLKEKAADVMLAVEMHKLAVEDQYDAAYVLSADGDFTPAVQAVRDLGKKVYCASPAFSYALKNSASAFINLPKDWFRDCYLK